MSGPVAMAVCDCAPVSIGELARVRHLDFGLCADGNWKDLLSVVCKGCGRLLEDYVRTPDDAATWTARVLNFTAAREAIAREARAPCHHPRLD